MKNNFIKLLCTTFSVASLLVSCTNDDSTSPASKICLVTSLTASGDTLRNTYEYDEKNHLTKLQSYQDKDLKSYFFTYIYNGKTIEENYVGNNAAKESKKVYTLGDNGFASSAVEINKGLNWETIDSVSFNYNKEGYLIQEDKKSYHKSQTTGQFILDGKSSTKYTISHGNRVKTVYMHGSNTTTSENEFYDKKNTTNLFNPASLTGKSDKDLIKKTTGNNYVYSYIYDFDENNNPVKATLTSEYNNQVARELIFLNYSCK